MGGGEGVRGELGGEEDGGSWTLPDDFHSVELRNYVPYLLVLRKVGTKSHKETLRGTCN